MAGAAVDRRTTTGRRRDDTGGVWIVTGVVLGALAYAGCVLMAVAGFAVVLPFVVIPPALIGLIGANNLLGGGRTYGRSAGRPGANGRAPLSSSGPNGPRKPEAVGRPGPEEPGEPT
jgi:hypothetical protein